MSNLDENKAIDFETPYYSFEDNQDNTPTWATWGLWSIGLAGASFMVYRGKWEKKSNEDEESF